MKELFVCCAFVLSLALVEPLAFAIQECGDIFPPESVSVAENCGDDKINLSDLVTAVNFVMEATSPDDCQASRADVPTGTPPNCLAPDGKINTLDLMVIIDMMLNRQDCCNYYYSNMPTCEGDFDCDQDVDSDDIDPLLADLGRNQYKNPCSSANPCNADLNCDAKVDGGDVDKFLEDFGRSQFSNPCPACVAGPWCIY
jgi:hypothetical protein